MPDITMCMKEDCPIKLSCYRFIAKPDKWQSYAVFIDCDEESEYEWWMDPDTRS